MKVTTEVSMSRTDVRKLAKIGELIQNLLAKLPDEFADGPGLRFNSERGRAAVNGRWDRSRARKATGAKEVA